VTRIVLSAAAIAICGLTLSNSPSAARAQAQAGATAADRASRTVLADGRTLVAGGSRAGRPIADVFIEDAAGKRSPLPAMGAPRPGPSARVLADGRVAERERGVAGKNAHARLEREHGGERNSNQER
jgi:hypothetical protein